MADRDEQLSVEHSDLLGKRWLSPHGDAEVVKVEGVRPEGFGFVLVCVERPERGTAFQCVLPAHFVRMELAEGQSDEWVPDGTGSFFNLTEHRRLAGLGLVPPAESAREPSRRDRNSGPKGVGASAEARQEAVPRRTRRSTVATATAKKRKTTKGGGLATLSKAKLRDKLLSTLTISDTAWNAAHGAPAREKGENRESYIRRVLQ